jgi:hypothetical protein
LLPFFIIISLVLVERHDQAVFSEHDLDVDDQALDGGLEDVHPLARYLGRKATGRVGRAQALDHFAHVVHREAQGDRLSAGLVRQTHAPLGRERADARQDPG